MRDRRRLRRTSATSRPGEAPSWRRLGVTDASSFTGLLLAGAVRDGRDRSSCSRPCRRRSAGAALYGTFRPKPATRRSRPAAWLGPELATDRIAEIETPRRSPGRSSSERVCAPDDYSVAARPSWPSGPPCAVAFGRRRRPSWERPWRLAAFALAFDAVLALAGRGLRRRLRRRLRRGRGASASAAAFGGSGLGARRLAQRGAGLAGSGLGALGLAGLAGGDAGLGGLGRGGLGRSTLAAWPSVCSVGPTERGVDLARQARLATGGGVRVDGADLGGPVEGAERFEQRDGRIVGVDRQAGRRPSGPSRRTSSRRCGAAAGRRGGSRPGGRA